jgi:hypothetical protein
MQRAALAVEEAADASGGDPTDTSLEAAFGAAMEKALASPKQPPLSALQQRVLESAKVVAWAYVGGMTELSFLANRGLQVRHSPRYRLSRTDSRLHTVSGRMRY